MSSHENKPLALANEYVETTGKHLFLTGKAGTGKTTFLKKLRTTSPKRMIVVAPTGVAAMNAGGVTIHSFFQLPFGPHLPDSSRIHSADQANGQNERGSFARLNREKKNIIRSLDLLVIDEISMVRADLLDGIDEVLRQYRHSSLPFGGVQLLMIGDLQQLAPIISPDERTLLSPYYDTFFFFGSHALQKAGFISIELQHIYRQTDKQFIEVLNQIRENRLDAASRAILQQRYLPHFSPEDNLGYISLTTHNAQANTINSRKLQALKEQEYRSVAQVQNDFPEYLYPTDYELVLKTGAQVMFVKNDTAPEKKYYNGKIGIVEDIDPDGTVLVQCAGDSEAIEVTRVEWQNMKYSINPDTREIEETPIGSFRQLPLKLAWAITIHKSQGLTFDRAIIDTEQAFAHGQVYVALSRCRSLEGVILSSPIDAGGIKTDATVNQFTRNLQENPPEPDQLKQAQKNFQIQLIQELFYFVPIHHSVGNCLKLCRSNASSFVGTPAVAFEKAAQTISSQWVQVAHRFIHQVHELAASDLLPEKNPPLQERIGKACAYFLEKLNGEILPILESILLETDNKEVKRSIGKAFENLMYELNVAAACLETCKNGFRMHPYMETRAKASLEKPTHRPSRMKLNAEMPDQEYSHLEAVAELKSWRLYQARTDGLPPYMILNQKALMNLARYLPLNTAELARIKGIGAKTIEKFGDDILQIILDYRDKNDLTETLFEPEDKTTPAALKQATHMLSYTLFCEGKSVEEIAGQRGLSPATVELHLTHYIEKGDLNALDFISPEKLHLIGSYYQNADSYQLAPAKNALGDQITYSELRFAVAHLKRNATDPQNS